MVDSSPARLSLTRLSRRGGGGANPNPETRLSPKTPIHKVEPLEPDTLSRDLLAQPDTLSRDLLAQVCEYESMCDICKESLHYASSLALDVMSYLIVEEVGGESLSDTCLSKP